MLWRGIYDSERFFLKSNIILFEKIKRLSSIDVTTSLPFWRVPSSLFNPYIISFSSFNTNFNDSVSSLTLYYPVSKTIRCWFFYPINMSDSVFGLSNTRPLFRDKDDKIRAGIEDTPDLGFDMNDLNPYVFSLRPGYIRLWVDLRVRLNGSVCWKFRRHISLSKWVLRASRLSSNRALAPIESLWYTAWKRSDLIKRSLLKNSYSNVPFKDQKLSCIGVSNFLYNWNYTLS